MMGKSCRSDLLEERSESTAYGRGCVVHEWNHVLAVLTSEAAENGAVKEGMWPLPLQMRSMLTSETTVASSLVVDPLQ
jgi:hypothetical protein